MPIETIHEDLVHVAQLPKVAESEVLANRLLRCHQTVETRAMRGEFTSLKELKAAMHPGDNMLHEFFEIILPDIQHAVNRLTERAKQNPAVDPKQNK